MAYRWNSVQQMGERPRLQCGLSALRIFDAATICIARVIWAVLLIDLMRRRSSRGLIISRRFRVHFQVCLNSSAAAFNSAFNASLSSFPCRSCPQLAFARGEVFRQLILETPLPRYGHLIQVTVLHGPDHYHLDLHRNRVVLGLLEDLHDAFAAVDLRLCLGVEVRAELCERRKLLNWASSPLSFPATCFMALSCAAEPTRETEMPTLIAGRTP